MQKVSKTFEAFIRYKTSEEVEVVLTNRSWYHASGQTNYVVELLCPAQ